MNYNQRPFYLCSSKKEWNKTILKESTIAGHEYGKLNGKIIIWPKKIDSETINPKNFIKLKKKLKLEEILLVDRLSETSGTVNIINHINRSGQFFLRGKTPEGKFPQFPDMSKIYNIIRGLDTVVVHTIGGKRFQDPPIEEKIIWSEAVGLIAPVAHYVGIKVFAMGSKDIDDVIKNL